jgi:hypothetical protein
MKIKARAALAGVLILLLAACGPDSARHVRPGGLGSAVESQGSRITEASALGARLPFSGGGDPASNPQSWELVTVSRVTRRGWLENPAGGRLRSALQNTYVEVELTIHNVGKPIYRDNPGRETSLVSASTGGYVGRRIRAAETEGPCRNDLLRVIVLRIGQTARGCVFFSVPLAQRVSAVEYQTDGGRGENAATWALDRFAIHG